IGGRVPLVHPLPREWGRVGPGRMPSRASIPRVWGGKEVSGATGTGGGMPSRTPVSARMRKGGAGGGVPSPAPFPHVPARRGQWGRVVSGGVPSHAPFLRVRGGAAKGREGPGREGEAAAACPLTHPVCPKGGAAKGGRGGTEGRAGRRALGRPLPHER
ncbi:hypothetical protein EDB84DRAFT_1504655, partial [Lactarius hengduanensis]